MWLESRDFLSRIVTHRRTRREICGASSYLFPTIKCLFIQCRFARSIWSVIQVASTLFPPCSITNIFGNWLNGIENRFKKHIRVGAIAFIWSLWLCRNDKVFNDKNSSILQVIYRAIGTLRLWSSLQCLQDRDLYTEVCARLEATASDTFSLRA
jgi:hypothetical protein